MKKLALVALGLTTLAAIAYNVLMAALGPLFHI